MALMKKYALEKNYVQVPNETAKDVENNISLQALGLIVNLWSYNIEKWELHKTELYKRYVKNKKTSVITAWDELIEFRYIIEFKYRVGKKWEYVYIYRIEPFNKEEIEKIMLECVEEYGVSSTSDFQLLKMRSSNCTPQNVHISNKVLKQEKEKKEKQKQNIKLIIEEDKAPFEINNFAFNELVKEFNETYPNRFDNALWKLIYQEMINYKIDTITFKEAVIQARSMQKKIEAGKVIEDYSKYFVGGIQRKRTSKNSALFANEVSKYKLKKPKKENENIVPFYNWLEQ